MPSTRPDESAERRIREEYDSPLERLRLLGGDDDEIAAFLDELEVRSPREREMLGEIARPTPLARPERFEADHRVLIAALESLRRHGYHGSRAGARLGRAQLAIRFLVELVARYVVVAHVKDVVVSLRNLYWLRELESVQGSTERELLSPARADAQALVEITRSRELGIPTFVLGGLLVPAALSLWRLASGFTFEHWWVAVVVGTVGVLVGLGMSWVVLRGAALASRRIRLSVREPLATLWETVGHCGRPPRDRSRRFTIVAISLTLGVWIVLPLLVTLSLATD
jgi:hypothetical protein